MQKNISILLILILMALPMLSIAASVTKCHQPPKSNSVSLTESTSLANKTQDADMDSQHDCCDKHEKICSHGDQCDCDSGQLSSSLISNLDSELPVQQVSAFKRVTSNQLVPKTTNSLYRPPILIL